MAQQDDLYVGRIALVGLVSVTVTIAIVLFLQVLFFHFQRNQLTAPQFDQPPAETASWLASQQGKLVSYGVVDKERQVIAIPIDRAERLVLEGLAADPRASVTGRAAAGQDAPPPPAAAPKTAPAAGGGQQKEPSDGKSA